MSATESDAAVIRRVLDGDIEAYRLLVERHQTGVLALVRNFLPGSHDREDIAQDTFLAAYEGLATYDPRRGAFFTWIARIARNRSLNMLKKRRPAPVPSVPEVPVTIDPGAAGEEEEIPRRLDRALAKLPFEQRAAFVMSEIHGISYEEISRIEGLKLGTVKSRIGRAREKLRRALARGTEA